MSGQFEVNGLQLPSLLVSLVEAGRWRHPGDDALRAVIPFLSHPVDFLRVESMRRETRASMADDHLFSTYFRYAREPDSAVANDLTWLDADRAVIIAVNRFAGEDVVVALDYRIAADNPRDVASEWLAGPGHNIWRAVSATFVEFARLLDL